MRYVVKIWKEVDYQPGPHISTIGIDEGYVYDDWWTSKYDPGLFRIGEKGEGQCTMESYGSIYLWDGLVSLDIVALFNFENGDFKIGARGWGRVKVTTPPTYNQTAVVVEITNRY